VCEFFGCRGCRPGESCACPSPPRRPAMPSIFLHAFPSSLFSSFGFALIGCGLAYFSRFDDVNSRDAFAVAAAFASPFLGAFVLKSSCASFFLFGQAPLFHLTPFSIQAVIGEGPPLPAGLPPPLSTVLRMIAPQISLSSGLRSVIRIR